MTDDPNNLPPEGYQKDELLELFEKEERSYFRRIIDMFKGFGKPKDSVEFKEAMIELQRLGAPIAAVLIIGLAFIVMCAVEISADPPPVTVQMEIVEPTETEELTKEPEPPPEEPPELDETPVDTDVVVDIDAPPSPTAEQSPQPSPVDSVMITKSPVIMKNVMGSRNPGTRGGAIGRYGAYATEKLVYGFLRFLKMKQGQNGLWNNDTGDTSLALLCFLAHGELPNSPEFGDTVRKAIEGLLNDQIKTKADCKPGPDSPEHYERRRADKVGYFRQRDGHNYAHMTAVYALAEAYALTRIPDIKAAVELALPHIIEGQNADGGWYYNMYSKCPVTDTSYASWAVQALKAAKLAGFHDPKLITALKKAARGVKAVGHPDGSFGYTNKNAGDKNRYRGLTAPCVLILQMLDEGDTDLCRKGIAYMDTWEPTFQPNFTGKGSSAKPMAGNSPQYYCYYLSQVRFNLGDRNPAWIRWNEQQKRVYQAAAINIPAEKSGYVDHQGKPQYITYWGTPNGTMKFKGDAAPMTDEARLMADKQTRNGKRGGIDVKHLINRDNASANLGWHNTGDGGRVLSGCFTALQLMVYYRNSPLAKGALTKIEAETEVKVDEGASEVTVEGIDDL